MDSLITAAARALAAGDPLGALKRVALRDDAPALALRGIAMAQLGDLARARGCGDRDAAPPCKDRARCARSGRGRRAPRRHPGADGGGRERITRPERTRGAPGCAWRRATARAR